METVGLNRAHTESHRDKSTNAEIDIQTPHTSHFSPGERFDRTGFEEKERKWRRQEEGERGPRR